MGVFTMTWATLFLVFLHHLAGSYAQLVLTQPKSVSGSQGSTVSISCNLSGGNFRSSFVHWYQQHLGRPPTPVIYGNDQRPTGVPDRFSGSFDSSSNSASLMITNTLAEDEADYYCQSSEPFGDHSDVNLGGSETKTSQSTGCESICDKTIALLCLFLNVVPLRL